MFEILRFINRLRLGQNPIFLEYAYDFKQRWGSGGNPHLLDIFEGSRRTIETNIESMISLLPLVESLCNSRQLPKIKWKNSFIPALDGMSLMWAAARSKSKFIEIGSGNSTIFIRRSLEHHGLKTRLISVDP